MRSARLELTSYLDVLTIVLLALLLAQRGEEEQRASDVESVVAERDRLRTSLDAVTAQLPGLEQRAREAEAESDRLRTSLNEMTVRAQDIEQRFTDSSRGALRLRDMWESLDQSERAATDRLLSQTITIVYFQIRGDRIVSYRRLGESTSTMAVDITTRRVSLPNSQPTVQYNDGVLQLIEASVPNDLVQRSPEDRCFYVFVDDDGLTSCEALNGLRRELGARPELTAVLPQYRCE